MPPTSSKIPAGETPISSGVMKSFLLSDVPHVNRNAADSICETKHWITALKNQNCCLKIGAPKKKKNKSVFKFTKIHSV